MGGLGCVMPYAVCCGLNFIFDLILRSKVALSSRLMPYGIFMAISIAAEGAGAFFGWNMYKSVRDLGLGMNADMEMGSGGLGGMAGGFLGGGSRQYQPAQQQQSMDQSASPQQGEAPVASGFQPFGGSGQRLGS